MRIIGIDVGKKGVVTLITIHDGNTKPTIKHTFPMPFCDTEKIVDGQKLLAQLGTLVADMIVLEYVSSRPTDGVVQAFDFGRQLGAIEAVLQNMHDKMHIIKIRPSDWKRIVKKYICYDQATSAKLDTLLVARCIFGKDEHFCLDGSAYNEGAIDAALIAFGGFLCLKK